MRKLFAILLCGVFVCFGGFLTTGESHAAHWADQYLYNLVSEGVMHGDDSGSLYPDDSITRAEFVAMMNRAFGYSEEGKIKFNDVPEDAWYYDDICIAYKQGYFTGIYNDTAGPDTYLQREQAVAMLCRALKIEETDDEALFTDNRSFNNWSRGYINASVKKDFLSGYPDQTFRPTDYMTRGEMAKVLSKVSGEIVNEEGDSYIGTAAGNVSVVESGAILRDTTIPGDLYITAGMGTGYSQLDDVTVGGDLIISGTGNSEKGEISVILTDCDINRIIIDCDGSNTMSVRAEGTSVITDTVVKSNAYLEEDGSKKNGAFRNVELKGPNGTKLSLSGDFEEVIVRNEGNKLSLDKGSIDTLTIDEDAVKGTVFLEKDTEVDTLFCDTATAVTGTGAIDSVVINAAGTTISMLPETVYIRPGITATINGKAMTSLEAEANSEDPEFSDDYPKYDELAATSVNLYVMTNKPGKVYWAVKNVEDVDSGMTEDEVMKPDKTEVVKYGTVNVVTEKEVIVKVSGLTSGVNYEYYMVFEDLKEDYTDVEEDDFTTIDTVIPKFLNSTPKIATTDKDSFTVTAIPSKDVTIYWAVLPTKSISPTVDTLVAQKISGAIIKGSASGKMNESQDILMEATTTASALSEKVTYDIYMAAEDESGNLSKLSKITGTTLDATDPEFMNGYPWAEPGEATALKIRHMSNEDGTLYWATYAYDTVFPPVDDAATLTGSALKTAKVRAVTTGQKAIKSGKVNVTAEKDALLSISGLEKQTPYDVYFVIMDKAGNYSEVASLTGLKTVDTFAPTATMKFEKTVSSKPTIDSDIMIVFDEIVYYNADDGTDVRLKDATADQLKEVFTLHDKLITTGVTDAVADSYVTYGAVAVAEEDGKTIVTFGSECFNNGSGLNSGGTYQFELNDIVDSEGNAMEQQTLLDKFYTCPPLVFMSTYDATLDLDEIGFTINPDTVINSDMYFDLVLQSNQQIKFNLYIGDEPLEKSDGTIREFNIQSGNAKMVELMRDATNPTFATFAGIETTNYKLKILSVNGNTDPDSWDATLTLNVMAVVGKPTDLTNLGNSIDGASDPLTKVSDYDDTLVVSNPSTLKVTKIYSDTVNPEFINGTPKFEVLDTVAEMTIMTDKASTMYYVVAESGTISSDVDVDGEITSPTADQIMAGLPSPTGSQASEYALARGNTDYTIKIENLTPSTDDVPSKYEIFYVLKAKSEDGLKVGRAEFTTSKLITPNFLEKTPIPTATRTDSTVEFKMIVDTDSEIYWVLYPYGAYNYATINPQEEIIEAAKNEENNAVSSGNVTATANKVYTITATGMKPTRSYSLFAVAKSKSGEMISAVAYSEPVRSKDSVAPTVQSASTSAESYTTDGTTSGAIRYKGSVTVLFSEALYYSLVEGGTANPLTEDKLTSLLSIPSGVTTTVSAIATEDGNEPITLMTIDFDGIKAGDSIIFPGHIYDKSVNHAGQLIMVFDAKNNKFEVSLGAIEETEEPEEPESGDSGE